MRISPDELLAFLSPPPEAQVPLADWLKDRSRFLAFADAHRDKIRKKLRTAADVEGVRDVLSELETAHALLREPRFELSYEAHASSPGRAPDFTLTYRARTLCHVEAARLRGASPSGERLHELVCGKLGQMLPNAPNVLVIATSAPLPSGAELEGAFKRLQARVERGDEPLLRRYRFDKRSDFFKFYARMSAVVLRNGWDAEAPGPAVLWRNKQARPPLPDGLARALPRAFSAAL